MSVMN